AGFKTKLLSKDIDLFLKNAEAAGTPAGVARTIADLWRRCDEALPDSDFTRVYEFLTKKDSD
ncbi:MAG: NAD-binding protein, partial [Rhodospirillales bacterium]|nr:NAD-binding protein [Rhodospirillales bacterium]